MFVAVALGEPRVQLRDERLVHRRLAVEPLHIGHRGLAEQLCVQPPQLGHRQHRLFDCGAADLIANDRRTRVPEQQVEHARLAVEPRVVARRDGTIDPRSDIGVEPHLTLVEAERQTRLPTHRIAGGDLEHDRSRPGRAVRIGQRDAVALTHLPGADPLGVESFDRARADGSRQPLRREVLWPLQVSDGHSCCPCGRRRAAFSRRRVPGCGRRTRTA